MEHKIIHTENYLLIVEDFKIDVGDYYLTSDNTILQCEKILLGLIYSSGDYGRNTNGLKRITSHLPLNNFPILEGVSLLPDLPPIQDEVEKLAKQEAEKLHNKGKHDDWDIYNQLVYEDAEMIKIGYNKAKEKYKFTEEDMKECVMYILRDLNSHNEVDKPGNFVWTDSFNKFIESTQCLKFPTGFKSETKWIGFDGDLEVPKTLMMDGQRLWIGEYVY